MGRGDEEGDRLLRIPLSDVVKVVGGIMMSEAFRTCVLVVLWLEAGAEGINGECTF